MTYEWRRDCEYSLRILRDVDILGKGDHRLEEKIAVIERFSAARCGILMAAYRGVYACDLCKAHTSCDNLLWTSETVSGVDLCDQCIKRGFDANWTPIPPRRKSDRPFYSLAALKILLQID